MRKKKIKVDKRIKIVDLLSLNPNVKEILMGFGLHCLTCPMAQMESLEEACFVHDVDPDLVIEKITEFLNQ